MSVPTVDAPAPPSTLAELRDRLTLLGIDVEQVQSIEIVTTSPACLLLVKVTRYVLDPLGQRFLLLDEHGEGTCATETRLLPLAAVLG